MANTLKVMVVDDTITYRMIMKKVAESISGIQVVATVSNGKLALDKINSQFNAKDPAFPDVVLLDVEMPVMDGLTSLKEINKKFPNLTVIMVSGLSRSNANIIMECLNAGALDFITKPMESDVDRARESLRKDLEPILSVIIKDRGEGKGPEVGSAKTTALGEGGVAAREVKEPETKGGNVAGSGGRGVTMTRGHVGPKKGPGLGRSPLPIKSEAKATPHGRSMVRGGTGEGPELVLMGSSTGGPAALTRVLARMGGKLPVPMLIVQHMPPVFTASLASQLSRTSGLDVREAQDADLVEPGKILIAQGGRHMTLVEENRKLKVVLNDGPKVNECRPAVDVLFMSAMACFHGRILAVVLTGMGRDGANGVDALKRMGRTYCITQDQKTCVVYGMPRSVDEKGLSDLSLPLDEIGPKIAELCGNMGS
ncbi:MAG: chemotaxis-specific protein-glutamate methyltransferase CheB [Magnetococcales bacterium]|nr:chemotaxis-specific protein-glutamate methyltransferase CheB [Magnetococcales bacterium]